MQKIFIMLITCAIIIPVSGADWEIYGNAFFKAWFVVPNDKNDLTTVSDNPDEQSYFDYGGDGGRLGLKMYYDFYEGRIEAGYGAAPDFGITIKHAWLQWNVTDIFNFTVGQTWTPMTVFPSNMTSAGFWSMLNCGLFYTGSQPQLIFGIKNVSIAFIVPFVNQSEEENVEIGILSKNYTNSTLGKKIFSLPKVEVSYKYEAELWNVNAGLGVQLYELKMNDLVLFTWNEDTIIKRFDNINVASAVFNADVGVNLEIFYGNIAVSGGFNYGVYGCKNTTNVNSVYQIEQDEQDNSQFLGKFVDEITYGGVLTVGLKINEFIKPEFGIGMVASSRGTGSRKARYYNEDLERNLNEQVDLALRAYIQLNIMSPIEIITFTPEIGYADELTGNQGQNEMKTIFGGCYISADF
ncbi:MAG: hypothetical protein PVI26_13525 [Chitinispirillia bacterium]